MKRTLVFGVMCALPLMAAAAMDGCRPSKGLVSCHASVIPDTSRGDWLAQASTEETARSHVVTTTVGPATAGAEPTEAAASSSAVVGVSGPAQAPAAQPVATQTAPSVPPLQLEAGDSLADVLSAWLRARGYSVVWTPRGSQPEWVRDVRISAPWSADSDDVLSTLASVLSPFAMRADLYTNERTGERRVMVVNATATQP